MSMWNPQWVLFATPFLVFGAVINKKPNIFLFLDILLMFFFVGFTVNYWENHVDKKLFTHGVFQYAAANIHLTDGFLMKDVFRINDKNTFYTMFSAIFLIKAVFSHPKYCMDDMNIEIDKHLSTIRLRFIIGISIFVVPAFVCLASHILKN